MLSQVTNFDIEEHAVGLFHWFDKSSKQKPYWRSIMSFVTLTIQRLLNLHRRTGCAWKCVLKSYFLSASAAGDRFRRLKNALRDPMLEIYLLFYQGVLLVLTTFNMCLQREEPLIYQLFEAQERFMNKLAARFIKSGAIQKIKTKKNLLQNLIFFCKIKKTTSILELSFSPSEKWTTFWKRRYFSRSFWQILW